MVSYTFLKRSKQWAVVGPPDEVRIGPIKVVDKFGHAKTERIIKVTSVFANVKDGQPVRLGILAILPRGRVS